MTLTIPFDAEIYKEQSLSVFDMIWAKALKGKRTCLWYGLGTSAFGSLMVFGKSKGGYVFIALGIMFLFWYIIVGRNYNQKKKEYVALLDKVAAQHVASGQPLYWEIEASHFRYKDCRQDLTLQWIVFTGIHRVGNSFYLEMEHKPYFPLSEREVGPEKYQEALALFEKYIPKQTAPQQP